MKKSVLFVLFALISVAGFSQIAGWNAKVGMNFSNYTGDLDLNAKVGFKLGGGFEYAFNDTKIEKSNFPDSIFIGYNAFNK